MSVPEADFRSGAAAVRASAQSTTRGWVVTFLLLVFMLINFADKSVLGLAADPIRDELGLSASQYGLLSSSFFILFSISAIVVGFISTRVSTKWVLLTLAALWSVAQVSVVGVATFGVLIASRIVLGAAEGPANPMAMYATSKWFPNEKRSLPSAILNMGSPIGVMLAAPLLTKVIVSYGWRWAFFWLFVIGIVWVVCWAVVGKEGPLSGGAHGSDAGRSAGQSAGQRVGQSAGQRVGQSAEAAESEPAYRKILSSGTWLGSFAAGFAAYWTLALLTAWVPEYLETARGYSISETGNLVILPWAALAIFNLGQGVVTEWLMRRGVSSRLARGVIGGTAVLLAGIAMVLFPLAGGWLALALMAIAFSLGGVIFPIALTVDAEISGPIQRGAVLSISLGIITTAGLLAPYVTGRIVDAIGETSEGYGTAFVLAGVLSILGGIAALLLVHPERDAARLGLARQTAAH